MATRRKPPEPTVVEDPAVAAVLADLRELRLRLSSDLLLAASAVESDELTIAGEITAADRKEVQEFAAKAAHRLDAEVTAAESGDGNVIRIESCVAGSDRKRWRRAVPVLPAVAILAMSATAAAIVAPRLSSASHHSPAHAPHTVVTASQAQPAVATLHELQDAVVGHVSKGQFISTAARLHNQLAAMIASSSGNAATLGTVAKILHKEHTLIVEHRPLGSAKVLAASDRLVRDLLATARSAVPGVSLSGIIPGVPTTIVTPSFQTTQPTIAPSTAPSAHPRHHPVRTIGQHSPSEQPSAPPSVPTTAAPPSTKPSGSKAPQPSGEQPSPSYPLFQGTTGWLKQLKNHS